FAVPPILLGDFEALERPSLPLLESAQLFLFGDGEPELDDDRPVGGEVRLEVVDLTIGTTPVGGVALRPARRAHGRTRSGRKLPLGPAEAHGARSARDMDAPPPRPRAWPPARCGRGGDRSRAPRAGWCRPCRRRRCLRRRGSASACR